MPDQEPEEAAVRPEAALGKQLVADQVTHLKKVLADQVTHPKKVLADQVKTTQVKVPAVHQVIVPGKTLEEAQEQKLVEITVSPVEITRATHRAVVQAVHQEEVLQAAHRAAVPVVDQEQALAVLVAAAQAVHPEEALAVSVVAVQAVHREEALAVRVEAVQVVHPAVRPVSHLRIRLYRMILKKRKILPDR